MRAVQFLLSSIFALSTGVANAQESPWSLNIAGFSYHEDSSQRKEAYQVNPGIGLRYDFTDSWYTEGNFIARNSVKGQTVTLGVGYHTDIGKINNRPVKVGVQLMWLHYESPGKKNQSGYLPTFTIEYLITKKVTLSTNFFIKPKESVVFGSLNYRF